MFRVLDVVLPDVDSFCHCAMLAILGTFQGYIHARPVTGGVGGCWLFREIVCDLLVAVVKEERKGEKKIQGFP